MMRTAPRILPLGRYGHVHVWIGEWPDMAHPYPSDGLLSQTVPAGHEAPTLTTVAMEVAYPVGATQYGLLGLSWTPGAEPSELRLEVPWTQPAAVSPHTASREEIVSPRPGLPEEVASVVLEGLDAAARARMTGGALTVRAAAYNLLGTNQHTMRRLARACAELMLRGNMDDAELSAFLEETFLR